MLRRNPDKCHLILNKKNERAISIGKMEGLSILLNTLLKVLNQ